MRTMTSGKGKVHHIPANRKPGNSFTFYLCGQSSIQAVTHEDGTVTCKKCLGAMVVEETEAHWHQDFRQRQAENERAYAEIARIEAEELAARRAARTAPKVVDVQLVESKPENDEWTSGKPLLTDTEPTVAFSMRSAYLGGESTFHVLFIGPNGTRRSDRDGRVQVPGPHAFLIPMTTSIGLYRHPQVKHVHLNEGDTLILNGIPMVVMDEPNSWPVAVTPAQYGARLAARAVKQLHTDTVDWKALAGEKGEAQRESAQQRERGLRAALEAVKALYTDGGHDTLPWYHDHQTVKPHTLRLHDEHVDLGFQVLGSETREGREGVWLTDEAGSTPEWWSRRELESYGLVAVRRGNLEGPKGEPGYWRPHVILDGQERRFEVLGSEYGELLGLRGVWVRPEDGQGEPRWVAEDVLLNHYYAV